MPNGRIYLDDQGGSRMEVLKEDLSPCIMQNGAKAHALIVCSSKKDVVAFAQNTREEVRDLGNCAGCVSAESGSHQTTYVCIRQSKDIKNNKTIGGGHEKHKYSSFFRAGSYGMFEPTQSSGTLDFLHCSFIGNGIPCIVVSKGT